MCDSGIAGVGIQIQGSLLRHLQRAVDEERRAGDEEHLRYINVAHAFPDVGGPAISDEECSGIRLAQRAEDRQVAIIDVRARIQGHEGSLGDFQPGGRSAGLSQTQVIIVLRRDVVPREGSCADRHVVVGTGNGEILPIERDVPAIGIDRRAAKEKCGRNCLRCVSREKKRERGEEAPRRPAGRSGRVQRCTLRKKTIRQDHEKAAKYSKKRARREAAESLRDETNASQTACCPTRAWQNGRAASVLFRRQQT